MSEAEMSREQKYAALMDVIRAAADSNEFRTEMAVLEFQELVCSIMAEQGVTRAGLARRMGRTRSHVTHVLSGDHSPSVSTMVSVLYALGYRLILGVVDVAE